MQEVLIVAHLLIVVAMIAVILLQRSEGGALGIGGSAGGLMSARGSANLLTRTTAILAALFFATSVGLTVLSQVDRGTSTIVDRASQQLPGGASVLDQLNALGPAGQGSDADAPAPDGAADSTLPAAPVSQ